MSTPLYDGLLSEVLAAAHVHRDRLATVRAGVDRLHGTDPDERCVLCGTPWPCATRQLVDGLARGELDAEQASLLVERALTPAPEPAAPEVEPEPVRPAPRVPGLADLLDAGRTGRALDVLLGRRPHA